MTGVPRWVTDLMAEDVERSARRVEALYGPCVPVDEARALVAELRRNEQERAS